MRLFIVLVFLCVVSACNKNKVEKPASSTETSTKDKGSSAQEKPNAGEKTASQKTPLQKAAAPAASKTTYAESLLLSYARFQVEGGKVTAKPEPAMVEILRFVDGKWETRSFEDPQSNVFHKALFFEDGNQAGILTFGGMEAAVKFWEQGQKGFEQKTLWTEKFGGKFNRMRDAEFVNLDGDPELEVAVGTHDQGVVAWLDYQKQTQTWAVNKIDRQKDTFIHEIEVGDLNKDGVQEIYATPSEPNKLAGGKQHGQVVRYTKSNGYKREVVADLGNRHAKEILVDDVDGDGVDELYVVVEALVETTESGVQIKEPVEIRRIDDGDPKTSGVVIGRIEDRLCRFLTAGDVDGDGKKELVAAAFRSGLWLLQPGKNPKAEWSVESIDRDSSGFEHAALLTDLDGDGADELYVAADTQGEIRQYTWVRGRAKRKTIHKWDVPNSRLTWNLTVAPAKKLTSP